MSNVPDIIWLQIYMDDDPEEEREEITWADHQIGDADVEYIRADLYEDNLDQVTLKVERLQHENEQLQAENERLENRIITATILMEEGMVKSALSVLILPTPPQGEENDE